MRRKRKATKSKRVCLEKDNEEEYIPTNKSKCDVFQRKKRPRRSCQNKKRMGDYASGEYVDAIINADSGMCLEDQRTTGPKKQNIERFTRKVKDEMFKDKIFSELNDIMWHVCSFQPSECSKESDCFKVWCEMLHDDRGDRKPYIFGPIRVHKWKKLLQQSYVWTTEIKKVIKNKFTGRKLRALLRQTENITKCQPRHEYTYQLLKVIEMFLDLKVTEKIIDGCEEDLIKQKSENENGGLYKNIWRLKLTNLWEKYENHVADLAKMKLKDKQKSPEKNVKQKKDVKQKKACHLLKRLDDMNNKYQEVEKKFNHTTIVLEKYKMKKKQLERENKQLREDLQAKEGMIAGLQQEVSVLEKEKSERNKQKDQNERDTIAMEVDNTQGQPSKKKTRYQKKRYKRLSDHKDIPINKYVNNIEGEANCLSFTWANMVHHLSKICLSKEDNELAESIIKYKKVFDYPEDYFEKVATQDQKDQFPKLNVTKTGKILIPLKPWNCYNQFVNSSKHFIAPNFKGSKKEINIFNLLREDYEHGGIIFSLVAKLKKRKGSKEVNHVIGVLGMRWIIDPNQERALPFTKENLDKICKDILGDDDYEFSSQCNICRIKVI